jgi:hypothetical protein
MRGVAGAAGVSGVSVDTELFVLMDVRFFGMLRGSGVNEY